jgi:predicted MFS family arabinose efflux permease
MALMPSLVERRDLGTAVGLNSMTWNLARVAGPALAALSVQGLGIPASFAVNAASYLALVVGVLMVHPRPVPRGGSSGALAGGVRLLRANPRLLVFLGIVAVVGFASDPINTLAPAFAHAFGHRDTWAGLIIGVFGAGAVTTAFLVSGRNAGSNRRAVVTLTMLAGCLAAFSVLPHLTWAVPVLFLGGVGYLASNTSATVQLQLSVDEHERGRVMALWNVAFLGLRPFASLTDGAIASGFGVRAAGVALEVPALLAAVLLAAATRRTARGGAGAKAAKLAAPPS